MKTYPECGKWGSKERHAISQFLEWLREEKGVLLCQRHKEHTDDCFIPHEHNDMCTPSLFPCPKTTQMCVGRDQLFETCERDDQIVMEYLEIDSRELESERRAMIEATANTH